MNRHAWWAWATKGTRGVPEPGKPLKPVEPVAGQLDLFPVAEAGPVVFICSRSTRRRTAAS